MGTKKRKVNVFEYNNLVNINKKMRISSLNKPSQRTDIIHLESSLDFEKDQSSNNMNKVMMSQRLSGNYVLSRNSHSKYKSSSKRPDQTIKKSTLKGLKLSSSEKRFTNESTSLGHTNRVITNKYYDQMKNGGRRSENDDRKTYISSTDRYGDSTSPKSKGYMTNAHFKIKRINKKTSYNALNEKASITSGKQSYKIIIKRNDSQKIINKRK